MSRTRGTKPRRTPKQPQTPPIGLSKDAGAVVTYARPPDNDRRAYLHLGTFSDTRRRDTRRGPSLCALVALKCSLLVGGWGAVARVTLGGPSCRYRSPPLFADESQAVPNPTSRVCLDCDKAMHCFLSHLSRHFRHDVVKEPERGHVEQLVTELRPADDSLQHLPRHRDLRRTE